MLLSAFGRRERLVQIGKKWDKYCEKFKMSLHLLRQLLIYSGLAMRHSWIELCEGQGKATCKDIFLPSSAVSLQRCFWASLSQWRGRLCFSILQVVAGWNLGGLWDCN